MKHSSIVFFIKAAVSFLFYECTTDWVIAFFLYVLIFHVSQSKAIENFVTLSSIALKFWRKILILFGMRHLISHLNKRFVTLVSYMNTGTVDVCAFPYQILTIHSYAHCMYVSMYSYIGFKSLSKQHFRKLSQYDIKII